MYVFCFCLFFCFPNRSFVRAHMKQGCVLCPVKGGAMKRTTDWKWAHLACALWIPEVFFRNPDGREPIDYLQIPMMRWNLKCCHCGKKTGACMQCSQPGKHLIEFDSITCLSYHHLCLNSFQSYDKKCLSVCMHLRLVVFHCRVRWHSLT
jgi:hypothetical protein